MDTRQQVFENFEVPDPIRIKKVIKLIRQNFTDIKGLNILECGVTNGGVVDLLKNEGANCFGADINPRHLEGVNTKQADFNGGIPDFSVKFDVIFAGEVIEHLFDDSKFIENAKNLLKQDRTILALSSPYSIGDYNKNQIPDLMIKFKRNEVVKILSVGDKIPIIITGKIFQNNQSNYFKGEDEVRVKN